MYRIREEGSWVNASWIKVSWVNASWIKVSRVNASRVDTIWTIECYINLQVTLIKVK